MSSVSRPLVKTPEMLSPSSRDERDSPVFRRWNQLSLATGWGAAGAAFCSTFLVTTTLPAAGWGAASSSGAISVSTGSVSTGDG